MILSTVKSVMDLSKKKEVVMAQVEVARDPRQSEYAQFLGHDCLTSWPTRLNARVTEEVPVGSWVVEVFMVPGGHAFRVVHRVLHRTVFAELLSSISFRKLGFRPTACHRFKQRRVFTARRRVAETACFEHASDEIAAATDLHLNLVSLVRDRHMPAVMAGGCRLIKEIVVEPLVREAAVEVDATEGFLHRERREREHCVVIAQMLVRAKPRSVVSVGYDARRDLIVVGSLHEFVTATGHIMPLTTLTHVNLIAKPPVRPIDYAGLRLVYSASEARE